MLTQDNRVPDFKARLTRARKEKAKRIPGFGLVNRTGQKDEKLKLPIPKLNEWFEESKAKMDLVSDASPGGGRSRIIPSEEGYMSPMTRQDDIEHA